MRIKYIQKTSLIDYPGHLSATIFVGGCNFDCAYCYNTSLKKADEEKDIAPEEILDILDKRKHLIEGVVITGGEPTIQPSLADFLAKIRKNTSLKIKLDTNGSNPDVLLNLLSKNLLDYIAMDIKAPLENYEKITQEKIKAENILRSIEIIKNSHIKNEFRTTIWQEAFLPKDILEMLKLIKGSQSYYLQNYFNSQKNDNSNFTPFSKEAIFPILEKAKTYVKKITLRGDWA
jgi:pyruvate formate lyase activating enzyme